jgi:hypothetical protein
MKKGLLVSILDSGFIDGLSPMRSAKGAIIIDIGCEVFQTSDEHPAVKLVHRNLPSGPYVHAVPDLPGMWAFGGRFIYSSDSRFRELNAYPIPLHDRNMSLEK